ncbi:MAG: hypothetical protein AABY37_05330 [Actinomycetota bacterium]
MRIIAVTTLSVSLAFALTACGAGNDAPTAMITQVTDGVEGSINTNGNDIKVRGLLLVSQPDGSAVLIGSMFNNAISGDNLLAIAAGGILATLSETSLPLIQNQPLHFAGESANAKAVIPDINAAAGSRVQVKFFFSRAGEMTLDAIVHEQSGIYAGVTA